MNENVLLVNEKHMEIAFKRKPKNLIKMLNIISIEKKFIKTVFLKLILFNRYTLKKHPST